MKVNSQVTVVIATLETFGNIISFLTWAIWTKITGGNPSFLMVFQGLLLNFVLLPYTFLMNTRYNKNRIIEGGWKVVIQNVKFSSERKARLNQKLSRLKQNPWKNKIEPSIYIVEYDKKPMNEVCTITIPKDSDSISSDIDSDDNKNTNITIVTTLPEFHIAAKQPHQVEEDESPHCSKDISQSLTPRQLMDFSLVRERLISDLLKTSEVEGLYVRNLMRLIRLEDAMKKGEAIQNIEFIEEDDIFPNMPHFVGNPERKQSMRMIMIQRLMNEMDDDMTYHESFEEFMDMEENFVENGC